MPLTWDLETILSAIVLGALLAGGPLFLLCVLLMHFSMPKAVLERYWKAPHFRPVELALFTGTIYAPMRTVMLMGAIAFPRLGRRRELSGARLLVPGWYRVASMVIVVANVAAAGGVVVFIVGAYIYSVLTHGLYATALGDHLGTGFLVLCIVLVFVVRPWWLRRQSRRRMANSRLGVETDERRQRRSH